MVSELYLGTGSSNFYGDFQGEAFLESGKRVELGVPRVDWK